MNSINLSEVEKLLNSLNPMQVINDLNDDVHITIHRINYSYTTIRGNKKNGVKYLITNSLDPQINLKEKLDIWVKDFNKNKPYRAISNVKFLDGSCIGLISI